LQEISKNEMLWLIKNNYLKMKNGRYPDLTITNKQNPQKKTRYVPDYFVNIVREKDIV
jgi:hypothetical protein